MSDTKYPFCDICDRTVTESPTCERCEQYHCPDCGEPLEDQDCITLEPVI